MTNTLYRVEAEVMYSAKKRAGVWFDEKMAVVVNGDILSAIRKAKTQLLKQMTMDGEGARRATKVKITSVVQGDSIVTK